MSGLTVSPGLANPRTVRTVRLGAFKRTTTYVVQSHRGDSEVGWNGSGMDRVCPG